jgi:hypothetical protein
VPEASQADAVHDLESAVLDERKSPCGAATPRAHGPRLHEHSSRQFADEGTRFLTTSLTTSWCVCQFRHFRVAVLWEDVVRLKPDPTIIWLPVPVRAPASSVRAPPVQASSSRVPETAFR